MWPNVDASSDLGHGGYKVLQGIYVEPLPIFILVALFALHKVPARPWSTLVQQWVLATIWI